MMIQIQRPITREKRKFLLHLQARPDTALKAGTQPELLTMVQRLNQFQRLRPEL